MDLRRKQCTEKGVKGCGEFKGQAHMYVLKGGMYTKPHLFTFTWWFSLNVKGHGTMENLSIGKKIEDFH